MKFSLGDQKLVYFGASEPGVSAKTSGVSIEASGTGRGTVLFRYEMPAGSIIAMRQSTSALLNDGLTTVAPTLLSEGACVTTTVRSGRVAVGLTVARPDYILYGSGGDQIYIPPGNTLTLFTVAVNTAFIMSLGLAEILNFRL